MTSNWEQPLHPFCLPNQLVKSIQFNSSNINIHSSLLIPILPSTPSQPIDQITPSDLGCTVCQTHFHSIQLQRLHFKSDWHRFNLKLITHHPNRHPIHHDDFLSRLEQLQDSLSGSEDSDSNHSSDDDDNEIDLNLQNQFQSLPVSSQLDGPEIGSDKFQELLDITHRSSSRLGESSSTLPEDHELNIIKSFSPTSPIVWFNLFTSPSSTPSFSDQPNNSEEVEPVIQLGFYRCIFPKTFLQDKLLKTHQQDQLGGQYQSELSHLQRNFLLSDFTLNDDPSFSRQIEEHPLENGNGKSVLSYPPLWTLLMVGGGHFAAMVVSAIPKLRHVGKHKAAEMEPVILLHKTFHRYTTRRKQGGGQASHDAGGKGAAKSAGANLRRYNEQALAEDIQDLLNSWSDKIQRSDLIFIRSSKSNLKLFFNHNNSKSQEKESQDQFKLNRGDDRIRNFPFVTKRPTFNELKRCFNELTRVKVIKTTKQEIQEKELELKAIFEREKAKRELQLKKKLEQDERIRLEEEKKRKEKLPKEKTQEEKEKEVLISRWERIIDLTKKGKLEQLQEFIKKYDQSKWLERIPSLIVEETDLTNGCVSLLQIASMVDQAEVVEWMLSEGKSDPTIKGSKVGTKGNLTAYELANSRNTRNAFRRVMAKEPERWNWVKEARVPSGLTEELETSQATKNKEWKNKMKERMKERDKVRSENEHKEKMQAEMEAQRRQKEQIEQDNNSRLLRNSTVNRLGSNATRTTNLNSHLTGLSDAQQARLERERRARAAEARLQK